MEYTLNKTQKEMLALECFFPHKHRDTLERILFAFSVAMISFAVLFNTMLDTRFGKLWSVAEGFFLVSFALLLLTILTEIYFHSLRMRLEKHHEMSFATLLVIGLHHPQKKDLAKAFIHSHLGQEVVKRLGIGREMLHEFIQTKKPHPIRIPLKGYFHDVAGHLYDEDPYFRDFLERVHVSRDVLVKSSEVVEKKHHRHLSSRPFLSAVFHDQEAPIFSLDHATRVDIEELEHFYKIIITEQATQQLIAFFREDILRYISDDARVRLLAELIETSPSVILPSDVRNFLIDKKAE